MAKAHAFDEQAARRVVRAVVAVEGVDMHNPVGRRYPTRTSHPPPRWWGVIVDGGPAGEYDWDDERYWVQSVRGTNAGGDSYQALQMGPFEEDDSLHRIVMATNAAEIASGSHSIPLGTVVEVTDTRGGILDEDVRRFVFSASVGGGSILPVVLRSVDEASSVLMVQRLAKASPPGGSPWTWEVGFEPTGALIAAYPEPQISAKYYKYYIVAGDIGPETTVLMMVSFLGVNVLLQKGKRAYIPMPGGPHPQSEGAPMIGG